MEAVSYVIGFVSAFLILAGVYYLAEWNFPQDK